METSENKRKGLVFMKNTFSETLTGLKEMRISKSYDCQTKFYCGKCQSSPLIFQTKGEFSMNALQIVAVCTAVSVICLTMAIVKKIKK